MRHAYVILFSTLKMLKRGFLVQTRKFDGRNRVRQTREPYPAILKGLGGPEVKISNKLDRKKLFMIVYVLKYKSTAFFGQLWNSEFLKIKIAQF